MNEFKYTNPEEAVYAFDNLLASGKVDSIDEFLNNCSSDIRNEVRPLFELAVLLRDCSRKVHRIDFDTLLTTESSAKEMKIPPKHFDFPFKTTDETSLDISLERRSIMDDITSEVDLARQSIADESEPEKEVRRMPKRVSEFLRRLFRRDKRSKR